MRWPCIRVSGDTHLAVKALAAELHLSVGDTVELAVRRLSQHQMGRQLAEPTSAEEAQWLEADLA